MNNFYQKLCALLDPDPAKRGIAHKNDPCPAEHLARQLVYAKKALVVTGYAVPGCGAGETDGPPGAAAIAYVLKACGCDVTLVTDVWSFDIVCAARAVRTPRVPVVCVPRKEPDAFCRDLLLREQPTHVIAIERPGKNAQGHYVNISHKVVDDLVSSTDMLYSGHAVTVGIGDGGNELGCGNFAEELGDPDFCAAQKSDFALAASVSNWWGWGFAALLSHVVSRDLLPTDQQEAAILRACVAAGAADGVTKRQELSVDGLSLEENLDVLRKIRALL